MKELESAQALEASEVETVPQEEKDPLNEVGGRKFLLTVLGIVIFGIFTALGQMDVETYMYLFGALTAGYFGINVAQKKMLN